MNRTSALAVTHVADDMASSSGGVPAVVRQLITRLAAAGTQVALTHAGGDTTDLQPIARVQAFAPRGIGRIWHHAPGLGRSLETAVLAAGDGRSVVHLHGIWAAPQYLAARLCAKHGVPFVLTAHGMLQPWMWTQHSLPGRCRNQAYWRAFAFPAFRQATVLHAITGSERDQLHRFFPGKPIEVIPNAIDIPPQAPLPTVRQRNILFLGRLHPVKGVQLLIEAFAQAQLSLAWTLTVAGPAWSEEYLAQLKSAVSRLSLARRVTFAGPVYGEDKARLLATSWVCVLPSYSEVIGMVNLESAAALLPSITTLNTGLDDWEEGGGMLVPLEVAGLAVALRRAAAWTEQEELQRGLASFELVQHRYSWQVVLPSWQGLYAAVARGEGP